LKKIKDWIGKEDWDIIQFNRGFGIYFTVIQIPKSMAIGIKLRVL
jgi:hypothetical protein